MTHSSQLQEISEIERNAIGLPTLSAKVVADELDLLLASLSTQFHQYFKHHWVVEGPEHRDLHRFFEDAYQQTQVHLDAVAERMTTLGAVPTASLKGQSEKSFIVEEKEGVYPVREMVRGDLRNEQSLIDRLTRTIAKASELSDYGTETLLKGILVERQDRAHELDHYLKGDSLVRREQLSALAHES